MENRKRALGRGLEELFNNENLNLDNFEETLYETTPKDEVKELDITELIHINQDKFLMIMH